MSTMQQEFCNVIYGLMPTDNSFNINENKVTYVAKNGSIVKYTAPGKDSMYFYEQALNNEFEIIASNGENFVIKFELIQEDAKDRLYKTAMERKEKLDATAVSEFTLN